MSDEKKLYAQCHVPQAEVDKALAEIAGLGPAAQFAKRIREMKHEHVDSTPIEVPLVDAAAYIYPPPELEGPWLIRIELNHATAEATVTPAVQLFRHALRELGMTLA